MRDLTPEEHDANLTGEARRFMREHRRASFRTMTADELRARIAELRALGITPKPKTPAPRRARHVTWCDR